MEGKRYSWGWTHQEIIYLERLFNLTFHISLNGYKDPKLSQWVIVAEVIVAGSKVCDCFTHLTSIFPVLFSCLFYVHTNSPNDSVQKNEFMKHESPVSADCNLLVKNIDGNLNTHLSVDAHTGYHGYQITSNDHRLYIRMDNMTTLDLIVHNGSVFIQNILSSYLDCSLVIHL